MLWKSVATRRRHSRIPPFAKNGKDGPPTVLLIPARSKAWATPPSVLWRDRAGILTSNDRYSVRSGVFRRSERLGHPPSPRRVDQPAKLVVVLHVTAPAKVIKKSIDYRGISLLVSPIDYAQERNRPP